MKMEAKLWEQIKKIDSRIDSFLEKIEEQEQKFDAKVDSLMVGRNTIMKMLNKEKVQEDHLIINKALAANS